MGNLDAKMSVCGGTIFWQIFWKTFGINIHSEKSIFLWDSQSTTTFHLLGRYSAVITISPLKRTYQGSGMIERCFLSTIPVPLKLEVPIRVPHENCRYLHWSFAGGLAYLVEVKWPSSLVICKTVVFYFLWRCKHLSLIFLIFASGKECVIFFELTIILKNAVSWVGKRTYFLGLIANPRHWRRKFTQSICAFPFVLLSINVSSKYIQ